MRTVTYKAGDELRPLPYNVYADYPNGTAAMDLASGWTATVKVAAFGSTTALFTKTSGITLAATFPNVVIGWAVSGELSTLAAGDYVIETTLSRTADSKTWNLGAVRLMIEAAIT